MPGWSTDQQYLYLRTIGAWLLEPDLVLLATGENDLAELAFNRLTLDESRLPVRVESLWRMIDATGRMRYLGRGRAALPRAPWPGETWLQDHSHPLPLAALPAGEALGGVAVRRARPSAPEWLGSDPDRPIAALSPDDLQRALAMSPDFRLRYRRFLVEAMERRRAPVASPCGCCWWPTAARPGRPIPCWRASTTRVRPAEERASTAPA